MKKFQIPSHSPSINMNSETWKRQNCCYQRLVKREKKDEQIMWLQLPIILKIKFVDSVWKTFLLISSMANASFFTAKLLKMAVRHRVNKDTDLDGISYINIFENELTENSFAENDSCDESNYNYES